MGEVRLTSGLAPEGSPEWLLGSIEQAPRTAAARAAVAAATGAAPPTPPPSAPFTFRPTALTKQPAKMLSSKQRRATLSAFPCSPASLRSPPRTMTRRAASPAPAARSRGCLAARRRQSRRRR